jgi:hypothetical protein
MHACAQQLDNPSIAPTRLMTNKLSCPLSSSGAKMRCHACVSLRLSCISVTLGVHYDNCVGGWHSIIILHNLASYNCGYFSFSLVKTGFLTNQKFSKNLVFPTQAYSRISLVISLKQNEFNQTCGFTIII